MDVDFNLEEPFVEEDADLLEQLQINGLTPNKRPSGRRPNIDSCIYHIAANYQHNKNMISELQDQKKALTQKLTDLQREHDIMVQLYEGVKAIKEQQQVSLTEKIDELTELQEELSELTDEVLTLRDSDKKQSSTIIVLNQEKIELKKQLALFRGENVEDYSTIELVHSIADMATGTSRITAEIEKRQTPRSVTPTWSMRPCPVCLDSTNHPNTVFTGCGHVVCSTCAPNLDVCPQCRVSSPSVKIYGLERLER